MKVYVLSASTGYWDSHQYKIINIFDSNEKASNEKEKLEAEMSLLKDKYNHKEIEKLDDELDEYIIDFNLEKLPLHLKEFYIWTHQTEIYYDFIIKEFDVK
jgi:hypothetical protein